MNVLYRQSGSSEGLQALGPYLLEPLIGRDEEANMTCYRVQIAPNSRTRISYHARAEEVYFVLAGKGTAIIAGRRYPLAAGTFLRLPPGTTHGFVTDDEPLELLDIHCPGSWPDRDLYFIDESAPESAAEGTARGEESQLNDAAC